MLTVDGEQLNDSSFIIKALSAKLGKAKALSAEEEQWFRRGRTLSAHARCALRCAAPGAR